MMNISESEERVETAIILYLLLALVFWLRMLHMLILDVGRRILVK